MDKKTTKKQHFIPVMLLKRHVSSRRSKPRSSFIWQFDKKTGKEKEVVLKKICFQECLYELYDDHNEIIQGTVNNIENKLGVIEDKTDIIFDKMCKGFVLNENDFCFLYAFIAVQMLRMPRVLTFIQKYIGEITPKRTSSKFENIARLLSLDFASDSIILRIILDYLLSYNMYVFETKKTLILSGDTPVSMYKLFKDRAESALIVFPFDSKHYILLTKGNFNSFYNKADDTMADFCNRLTLIEGDEYYASDRISSLGYLNENKKIVEP